MDLALGSGIGWAGSDPVCRSFLVPQESKTRNGELPDRLQEECRRRGQGEEGKRKGELGVQAEGQAEAGAESEGEGADAEVVVG